MTIKTETLIYRRIALAAILSALVYGIILVASKLPVDILIKNIHLILFASIPTLIAFILKGVRFYVIIHGTVDEFNISLPKSIVVRLASEVFSFIGVSYIGDEVFRYYILRSLSVDSSKAALISYIEIFEEVIISFIFVSIGFLINLHIIWSKIFILLGFLVSAFILSINLLVIFNVARVIEILYKIVAKLPKFISHRIDRDLLIKWGKGIEVYRDYFFKDKKLLLSTIVISLLIGVSSGLSLYIILNGLEVYIDLITSIFLVYLVLSISTLPITVGGIGVSEAYLILIGSELSNGIIWILPILYRISSYYIPFILVMTMLLYLLKAPEFKEIFSFHQRVP